MFAHADLDACALGFQYAIIIPSVLEAHTMLLDVQESHCYGDIISWEDVPNTRELLKYGRGFDPGTGKVILEIQREILRFLLNCCEAILHDYSLDLVNSALTKQTIKEQIRVHYGLVRSRDRRPTADTNRFDSPLKQTRVSAQLRSLANFSSKAPYRLPAHLDFKAFKSVISAKRDAVEDHIWALREDPGYFKEHLGDYFECRQEHVSNSYEKPCRIEKRAIWDITCCEPMVGIYRDVIWWDMISKDFDNIRAFRDNHSASTSPDKELPQKFLLAFLTFMGLIFRVSQDL